jgi:hypothetical protein
MFVSGFSIISTSPPTLAAADALEAAGVAEPCMDAIPAQTAPLPTPADLASIWIRFMPRWLLDSLQNFMTCSEGKPAVGITQNTRCSCSLHAVGRRSCKSMAQTRCEAAHPAPAHLHVLALLLLLSRPVAVVVVLQHRQQRLRHTAQLPHAHQRTTRTTSSTHWVSAITHAAGGPPDRYRVQNLVCLLSDAGLGGAHHAAPHGEVQQEGVQKRKVGFGVEGLPAR